MTRYLARLELVDIPQNKDGRELYEQLHIQMEEIGFERTWKAQSGTNQLPDGTYLGNYDSEEPSQVAAAIPDRAKKVWAKARVLVCKAPPGVLASRNLATV
jgi:hypothetical protein